MTDMPRKLYACPRGSGTVSGVWTDSFCMDEPETEYTRSDTLHDLIPLADAMALVEALSDCMTYVDVDNLTMQTKHREWRTALSAFRAKHGGSYENAR